MRNFALASLLSLLTVDTAYAKPIAPTLVCDAEPDIPACQGTVPSCALCHDGTDPPRWNAFGEALQGQLTAGTPFETNLVRALEAVADDDSDGDGKSNLDELRAGSAPGLADMMQPEQPTPGGESNPRFRVGEYDFDFALRRVGILYCARSPSYEELAAFHKGKQDDATLRARLHQKLTDCLQSEYWRTEGLARLADKRIRPIAAGGANTDIFIGRSRLVIGDYNYDYRLWRYLLSEDRDLRELLRAKYHVVERDGKLTPVTGLIDRIPGALAGGQPVPDELRAGMLTTQWFLAINTMFSPLPRTTAAQAYRSYLGAEISNGEGLMPVSGEPVDVDAKGVAAPRCANCHSTLDPLSYAFADYDGIRLSGALLFGAYRPERALEAMPAWDPTKQKSMVLGTPVKSVIEWGQVASESDEFKRAMTLMFFTHALGHIPQPSEQVEFIALWRSLAEDGYSANRLLHRLIDTLAFGRP